MRLGSIRNSGITSMNPIACCHSVAFSQALMTALKLIISRWIAVKSISSNIPHLDPLSPWVLGMMKSNLLKSEFVFPSALPEPTSLHHLHLKIGRFSTPTIHFQVLLLVEEIRRSPVEVGSLSQYLQGFDTSQVVQNFFHQPYVSFGGV